MELTKETGIALVLENTDEKWREDYEMVLETLLMSYGAGREFTGTEVNQYIETMIGKPHSPNAWSAMFGSIIRKHLKHNLVVLVGFEKSVKASNHGHYYRKYRKV